MKDYKVETLVFYPNTLDQHYTEKELKVGIQLKLNEYASNGYKLISTSSSGVGGTLGFVPTLYVYLYFEKDV